MAKKITVVEVVDTAFGLPFLMPVYDEKTGLVKRDERNVPESGTGSTAGLLSHIARSIPKWSFYQGDSKAVERILDAARNPKDGIISLTDGDYAWLHGKSESGTGKGDGRVGVLDRIMPLGQRAAAGYEADPEAPDYQIPTVGMEVFGINESKARTYLKVK